MSPIVTVAVVVAGIVVAVVTVAVADAGGNDVGDVCMMTKLWCEALFDIDVADR